MFSIKHEVQCSDGETCILDIVTLTDVQSPSEDKVQVYISGALHGNERVGPHATYYLIEMLVNGFGHDEYITNLLKTREIILTPMTNAPGFDRNEREERMGGVGATYASSVDINRDFPYNQESAKDCLQTLAGRTVFRIFAENLIVTAVTFHGGTNSVTYPWGSNNHISTTNRRKGAEAPDHTALDSGAQMLVEAAG
jgi:predicted deacylase